VANLPFALLGDEQEKKDPGSSVEGGVGSVSIRIDGSDKLFLRHRGKN